MKLNKLFFISVITLTFSQVRAQDLKPQNQIYLAVTHAILGEGAFPFADLPKEKQAILFSIIVNIDKSGKVDKVEFTNPSNHVDSLLRYKQVSDEIKRDKKNVFKKYKNSIYVLPILIKKWDNNNLLITPEFLKDFEKLIPEKSKLDKYRSINIMPTQLIKVSDIQY
ncbi:hypothetical protein HDF26_004540 [Pedobacter cryoconitis]|uniref:hypothetical protein n=1 Tax=Pedobacter cryoconitis TaxID=188932 RepID=UPI001608878B|nr:hypothetical protein [Pedobacter cryoconitis]MBB6274067.1 hypothetical protein [Pedobacter cryoconitis]